MVAAKHVYPKHESDTFTYQDACRVAREAVADASNRTVLVAFDSVSTVTSAALAKLIALQRELLRSGGGIRLTGLHGHALGLYELYRLGTVLPQQPHLDNDRREP